MNPKVLPFYMTYPIPMELAQKKEFAVDLEYFQQLYPWGAKVLQKQIVKAINLIDYEGSMIYDEYPDQLSIRRLSKDILNQVMIGQKTEHEDLGALLQSETIEEYTQLLVMYEILKRRNQKENRYRNEDFEKKYCKGLTEK